MSHQIIQQPDGRFCVFSTVVDEIVIWNATPAQLVDHYRQEAADRAEAEARRVIGHVQGGNARKAYYQFTMTYDEAVAEHQARGGAWPLVAEIEETNAHP